MLALTRICTEILDLLDLCTCFRRNIILVAIFCFLFFCLITLLGCYGNAFMIDVLLVYSNDQSVDLWSDVFEWRLLTSVDANEVLDVLLRLKDVSVVLRATRRNETARVL